MIATLRSDRLLTRRRRFILLSSFLWLLVYGLSVVGAADSPQASVGPRVLLEWRISPVTRAPRNATTPRWSRRPMQHDDEPAAHKRSPASAAYLVSPVSQRLLEVGGQLDPAREIQYEFVEPGRHYDGQCLTLRSSVQVTREQLDPATGRPIRRCRGSVPLNRCEGACSSYTEPAVMSHSNLRQDCLCCIEAALRRFQVRLNDCYATTSSDGDNERLLRPPLDPVEISYMDVELSEPVQCKCRHCRPFL